MYPTQEINPNPIRLEQYKVNENTTGTRSSGTTIQRLIIEQLSRIDYLKTTPFVMKEIDQLRIISSIKYSLRSIESKLHPFLEDTNYFTKVNPLKESLNDIAKLGIPQAMETLSKWEDEIVDNLGLVELLPQGSKELEFD